MLYHSSATGDLWELRPLNERVDWQKVDSQRKYHTAVMVYKSINGFAQDYLSNMSTNRDSVSFFSRRHSGRKLAIPQSRTNHFYRFGYKGGML